jgi:ribose 5-phosphate isomerase A
MNSEEAAIAKKAAANYAVTKFIQPGMRVGLGSGSTAAFAVQALAARMKSESLVLTSLVSTSDETAQLARSLGLTVEDHLLVEKCPIDVTIDGADEVDGLFSLIKGGGGALLREKIVAKSTLREVIVVDQSKYVETLGTTFPLPVMVIPYGFEITKYRVEEACSRLSEIRKNKDGSVFVSNDGLYCLDVSPGPIYEPDLLEELLNAITGVVEVGLFVNIAKNVVIGRADGTVLEPVAAP